MLQILFDNFAHNLFKPLLLFFYAGFSIPLLGIDFEFPKVLYQGLTIYLLLAIGWHGGEELANLDPSMIGQACGFMAIGFVTNTLVGIAAYYSLRWATRLRHVDAAMISGYYGSDSAGTFVTCLGVLTAGHIAFAAYMPVLLAVMELPGCLLALLLVSRLRRNGMDAAGNMPGEPGYAGAVRSLRKVVASPLSRAMRNASADELENELVAVGADSEIVHANGFSNGTTRGNGRFRGYSSGDSLPPDEEFNAAEIAELEADAAATNFAEETEQRPPASFGKLMHEVFLNPGAFLLFAGLGIGFISRLQGEAVVAKNDSVFVTLFQGLLCLFLLEMGITAAKRLRDLKEAGWQFAAFALIAPNVFAAVGIGVAHLYSMWLGQPFEVGTYVLFAVLCGAASYIAVPAVQRMAVPEASPTLPLAASLGLTFSYNVTVGIPVYLMLATALTQYYPVVAVV